jgi:hypothetical protein
VSLTAILSSPEHLTRIEKRTSSYVIETPLDIVGEDAFRKMGCVEAKTYQV